MPRQSYRVGTIRLNQLAKGSWLMGGNMATHPSGHTPENQRRVYRCVEILATTKHHHEAVAAIRNEFRVSRRQADRYLHSARILTVEALKKDKDQHVADAYATYKAIVADPNAENRDKIRAQEALDRLLGLSAPHKVAPVDPSGELAWQQEKPEELHDRLLQRLVPSRQ